MTDDTEALRLRLLGQISVLNQKLQKTNRAMRDSIALRVHLAPLEEAARRPDLSVEELRDFLRTALNASGQILDVVEEGTATFKLGLDLIDEATAALLNSEPQPLLLPARPRFDVIDGGRGGGTAGTRDEDGQ